MEFDYEIFISYRRDPDFPTAELLLNQLVKRGCRKDRIYLDVHEDKPGEFPDRLRKAVKFSKHFILILSPNALDRCVQPGDWVAEEISIALENQINIVPVTTQRDFTFPIDFPEELSHLKDYQRIELNPEFFDASIDRLIKFINPSLESDTPCERNQTNKLWEKIRPYLFLSAIPFFALILFFAGRKVSEMQIGDKEKYVIQKIASGMTPKVINNQLYFKFNYKEKCLTYDVANDSIWLNPSEIDDAKLLNNAEIVLSSAFIANAGMWAYLKSLPSRLKLFNSKRKETIIATTVVIIVTSAYFIGKYTIEKDLKNPFDSENIDLLKKDKTLRRYLFDCFMQKNNENKFDDFVLDATPATYLRKKLKQSDEYFHNLKIKINDAKDNKIEFTPTEDDFNQLFIRLALYELLNYAFYNYKNADTHTKPRYSYKDWRKHSEIIDIMKKDNITPKYFAYEVTQIKYNDSPKLNLLQKLTKCGLLEQITQCHYSENIMDYGILRQIWKLYNKICAFPQAGDILLKCGECRMFSTNMYELNAIYQKIMSDSSRFPLHIFRPSSEESIHIDFNPNQIKLICVQVPVWDPKLFSFIKNSVSSQKLIISAFNVRPQSDAEKFGIKSDDIILNYAGSDWTTGNVNMSSDIQRFKNVEKQLVFARKNQDDSLQIFSKTFPGRTMGIELNETLIDTKDYDKLMKAYKEFCDKERLK